MKAMALFLSALVSAYAASPSYKLSTLVKVGDTIDGKTLTSISSFAINHKGDLVFVGGFHGGSGIFTPSSLLVQTGDEIAGHVLTRIFNSPSINDAGTVLFAGSFSGGSGVFTPSELLVKSGDVIDGETVESIAFGPVINNAGTVVFASCPCKFQGDLYTEGASLLFTPSHLLGKASGTVGGFPYIFTDLGINSSGTVVFLGFDAIGNVGAFSLFGGTSFRGCPYGVGGTGLGPVYSGAPPAINDSGTVVVNCAGQSVVGPSGVVIAGGFIYSPPAINSSGVVTVLVNYMPGFYIVTPFGQVAEAEGRPLVDDAGDIFILDGGILLAAPINSGVEGDVNGDGVVDCADLAIVRGSLGKTFGQAGFNPRADVNGDGIIDIRDLAFVAQKISAGVSCQ